MTWTSQHCLLYCSCWRIFPMYCDSTFPSWLLRPIFYNSPTTSECLHPYFWSSGFHIKKWMGFQGGREFLNNVMPKIRHSDISIFYSGWMEIQLSCMCYSSLSLADALSNKHKQRRVALRERQPWQVLHSLCQVKVTGQFPLCINSSILEATEPKWHLPQASFGKVVILVFGHRLANEVTLPVSDVVIPNSTSTEGKRLGEKKAPFRQNVTHAPLYIFTYRCIVLFKRRRCV